MKKILIILIVVVCLIIMGQIVFIGKNSNINEEKIDDKMITKEKQENEYHNNDYNQNIIIDEFDKNSSEKYVYEYDKNININDIYFDIPNDFEISGTKKSYKLTYKYYDNNKNISIDFSISAIKATSAENFIDSVAEFYNLSNDDIYSVEINGINWKIVGYKGMNGTRYYNAFDYDDNVFLYEYYIENGMEDDESYETIIKSIKTKKYKDISTYNLEFEKFNKNIMYGVDVRACIEKVVDTNKKNQDNNIEIPLVYVEVKCNDVDKLEISKEADVGELILSKDFRGKKFTCISIDYDENTGYISKIHFEEI